MHEETEERTVIHHSGCRFTDEPQLNPTALGRGHTEQEMKKYPIEGVFMTFPLPFATFVVQNSFAAMPEDFWEAAALDGAGTWRSLRVALPLASPGVITAALFAFFAAWNEFFIVLILLSNKRNTRMAGMGR